MRSLRSVAVSCFLISILIPPRSPFLFWPQFSVLQITASFSVPVEIPKRKLYFDWGFQMNYDLPYNVSSFYNVPIWPTSRPKRSVELDHYRKYAPNSTLHPHDMTAGEFYSAIEDILENYGFHETCLLKTVCELARHPFDSNKKGLLPEVLTFVLSPSIHEAFGSDEILYKQVYEEAELFGRTGNDCSQLFPHCHKDILQLISKVTFS